MGALIKPLNELWDVLTEKSENRKNWLHDRKHELEKIDNLQKKFSKETSAFNSWCEQIQEDYTDPIYAVSIKDIEKQISNFEKFKQGLRKIQDLVGSIETLNQQIINLTSSRNPYTWRTIDTVTDLWKKSQQIIAKMSTDLKAELNNQQINDRLCVDYAKKADEF